MSKNILIRIFIPLVVVFGVIILFSFQSFNKTSDKIRIGAVLSLSGSTSSFYGEYNRNAIELAKEKINSSGGIIGKKIEVVYEDSQGDKAFGLEAFNKLVATRIRAVISDISPVTLAIAPVAQSSKVLLIATSASNPTISEAGDYIFRTKMAAQKEGVEAAQFIVNDIKPRSVAFLYQNSDYGTGVFKAFSEQILTNKIPIIAEEKFAQGATDMRTQLSFIKSKGPDVIIVAGFPKEVGILLKQAKELGVNSRFFAHSGSIGPEIESVAGEASDGLMFLTELDSSSLEFRQFSADYSQRYGKEPELFASNAFDAFMLIVQSIEKCGGIDTSCMKEKISNIKGYKGVSGVITFDQNGDIADRKLTCLIKSVSKDQNGKLSFSNKECK